MEAVQSWIAQLQLDKLWELLVTVGNCLLCVSFHETCHGLTGYWLGDPTAKRAGRLTLNPMKHVDFFGLVMLAVAKFGWAKPVPVNMRNFRNPKAGMAITALAGPVSNVLLTWIAMTLYYVAAFYSYLYDGMLLYYIQLFFLHTAVLSAGLAVFNLFPIPPLDGSKVLFSVLPDKWYGKLMRYERYGMIFLAVLLLTGALDTPLAFVQQGLFDLLSPIASWPLDVLYSIYF